MMHDKIVPFQYDMFESAQERLYRIRLEESELTTKSTKQSLDKVRKKTFARIDELTRQVDELSIRVERMERYICRGE